MHMYHFRLDLETVLGKNLLKWKKKPFYQRYTYCREIDICTQSIYQVVLMFSITENKRVQYLLSGLKKNQNRIVRQNRRCKASC